MKLSQTFKAMALSGALLASQEGCTAAVVGENQNCGIEPADKSGAILENNEQVAEFCGQYRNAVITCMQTKDSCAVSPPYTTPCSDYQNNPAIQNAAVMAKYGGIESVTCVEGASAIIHQN